MSLTRTLWIDAPQDVVMGYFTDGDKMKLWSGQAAELDARPGGAYRLDMGAAGWFEGRFTTVDPGHIAWEVDLPGGSVTRIDVTLADEAGGTRVTVVQTGLPDKVMGIAARGWDHHLARLSVVCGGGVAAPDSLCARPMDSLSDP